MIEPILLKCNHYLCKRCLKGIDENSGIYKCPLCRHPIKIKIDDVKINLKLQNYIK